MIFFSWTEHAKATVFFAAPVTGTAGASAKILNQNNLRTYLLVQNLGSTILIVKTGSAISGSNEGVQVPGGGAYEPIEAPGNSIYIKALSGSPTYSVIEGN